MNEHRKHIKFWIITDDDKKNPFYSLKDFSSIPPMGVNRFIISDLEINNTVKRNRILLRKMEKIYRSKIK
jgi:hypothetical protein